MEAPTPNEAIRSLSPASTRAMAAAAFFSERLGRQMIVSEGLLAGLNEIEDGVTRAMLDYYDLGSRATLFRTMAEDLNRPVGTLPATIPASATMDELEQRSYSDNMERILEQALQISQRQSARQIQEYHLLYGILATETCQAITWLKQKGLLVEAIRTTLAGLRIDQKVQVDRFGTRLEVVLTEGGWRLPLDALVLPLKVDNGSLAGEFYQALSSDLGPELATKLESHLQSIYASPPPPSRPQSTTLPADWGQQVLPFPRQDQSRIVYFGPSQQPPPTGSEAGTEAAPAEPGVAEKDLVTRLAEIAQSNQIRRIALPVVASAPAAEDTPEPRDELAVEPVIDELWRSTDLGGLQVITLLTSDPSVVRAAHRKFNRYSNNRAQRLLNDEPRGSDLLDIKQQIYALAETLMLREVEPPLAVGVIGGWGSGKSFVMHLMQERMRKIRALPTEGWDHKTFPYAGHIYPISFNAWTYAKSDLWASLIHTILFDLDRQLSLEHLFEEDQKLLGGAEWLELCELGEEARQALLDSKLGEDAVAKWQKGEIEGRLWNVYERLRKKELDELDADQKSLEAEQDALRQAEEDSQTALEREARTKVLRTLLDKLIVGPMAEEFKQRLEEKLSDEDLEDLHALELKLRAWQPTLSELQDRLPQLLRERWRGVLAVVSLAAVALLFALVGDWLAGWTRTATVASILTALGSAGTALAAAFRTYQQWQEKTRHWREAIGGLVSAVRTELDTETANLEKARQKELDKTREDHEKKIKAIEQRISKRKERIGVTGQFDSLGDFVSSRLETKDYEARLGLMHQIQADLQEMTEALVVGRDDLDLHAAEKRQFFPRGQARVVLFIDDLDRCPPDKVVDVLEAVQLLLRTPLFVVVLAIDTRYITRALEKQYKEILIHQGDPSGLDYIEKIIQIPYRIRPAKSGSLDRYLQEQMAITGEREERAEREGQGPLLAGPTVERRTTGGPETATPAAEGADELKALPPDIVEFTWDDYDDALACCRQVSLTPRGVKRLLNVLKLIKIFWFRKLGRDETPDLKKTVAGLLALSAGYPEVMREVFVRLDVAQHDPKEKEKKIVDLLAGFRLLGALPPAYEWQLARFHADVESLNKAPLQFFDVKAESLFPDTFNLVRSFSFVGDPCYEIDSEEPAPVAETWLQKASRTRRRPVPIPLNSLRASQEAENPAFTDAPDG